MQLLLTRRKGLILVVQVQNTNTINCDHIEREESLRTRASVLGGEAGKVVKLSHT